MVSPSEIISPSPWWTFRSVCSICPYSNLESPPCLPRVRASCTLFGIQVACIKLWSNQKQLDCASCFLLLFSTILERECSVVSTVLVSFTILPAVYVPVLHHSSRPVFLYLIYTIMLICLSHIIGHNATTRMSKSVGPSVRSIVERIPLALSGIVTFATVTEPREIGLSVGCIPILVLVNLRSSQVLSPTSYPNFCPGSTTNCFLLLIPITGLEFLSILLPRVSFRLRQLGSCWGFDSYWHYKWPHPTIFPTILRQILWYRLPVLSQYFGIWPCLFCSLPSWWYNSDEWRWSPKSKECGWTYAEIEA